MTLFLFRFLTFVAAIVLLASFHSVSAATFQMQTGYYVGTGATLSISGVGFQPELVIFKAATATGAGAEWKTSAMGSTVTSHFTATADDSSSNVVLNSDGFTLTSSSHVNTSGVRWTWTAFRGSDCSSTGTFCVGEYTGDGAAAKSITVGFQPNLVWVKGAGGAGQQAVWRSSSMANNSANFLVNVNEDTTGTIFTTLDATGFTVGNSARVNTSGTTYHYVAFKSVTGAMQVGTYTGNATDNRSITGVGFSPNFVFVKNANAGTSQSAVFNLIENYGDQSSLFNDIANDTNEIQALESDGFQVGSAARANGSGNTHYWAAFGGASSYTASGIFTMKVGSYAGTGAAQSITGLGFSPSLVIIKNASQTTNRYAVFRTALMVDTAYFSNGAANITTGITSLDSDGFTVGTNAAVSTSGDTYYWEAFGNAFNPFTNSGAADFAIGSYTSNDIDNRNIKRIPFQPDFVAIKRDGTSAGAWRTSALTGDNSSFFDATAETTDRIQAFNSDGFQIGTALQVTNGTTLVHWFAFKSGTNFKVGTYSGTGSSQNVTDPGFQPDLVWAKQSTAVQGAFRPSSLTGATSQVFDNLANISNAITDFISTGFTVSTASQVNTSGGTYRYAAWNAKTYTQSAFRLFNNADSTDVGSALAAQDTAASLASTGSAFRLRMLFHLGNGNLYSSGQNFKLQFVGKGSGTCASPSGGTPASYTDITTTTAISYKNNATPADGVVLTANASDPTHGSDTVVSQNYKEANNFTNAQGAVLIGQDGKWDFALYDNGASASTAYCLRAVKSDGTALDTYTVYPQITTAAASSDTTSPAAVTNLAAGTPTTSSLVVSWTAPGDDASTGTATTYDLRYSTATITDGNFASATQVSGEPTPSVAGSSESKTVTGLSQGTTYYFALKTSDEVPNTSAISNIPNGTTSSSSDTTAPAAVTNLAASTPTTSSLVVSWTAPGDDNNSGTATTYDLRYSTATITDGNFSSATQVSGEPTPSVAGSSESKTVTGLSQGTTYYFALKTSDEAPNTSGISNIPNGTTSSSSDTTSPAAVTGLALSGATVSSMVVSWTAPGDDSSTGTATTYDLRYSTATITDGNFSSATAVSGEPTPSVAGSSESMTVSGLSENTTYYFALKTSDEVPNTSDISNVPSLSTASEVSSVVTISSGGGIAAIKPTSVAFAGFAYPDSRLKFYRRSLVDTATRNTYILDTETVADANGKFSKSFMALLQGEYFFAVEARDKDGRSSGILGFTANLFSNNELRADSIIVPPTVGLATSRIKRGDKLKFFGYATPQYFIELEIDGILKYSAQADANGYYILEADTRRFSAKDHFARVFQADVAGNTSATSPTKTFTVTLLSYPQSDFNNDGIINIKDWSIFLFNWRSLKAEEKKIADLDGNGKADINDFSIFLKSIKGN